MFFFVLLSAFTSLRLYNATLLELNATSTPLNINSTTVILSCAGNSSMTLTDLTPTQDLKSTRFLVSGCLVPLGVRVVTTDNQFEPLVVQASSDPGPSCFPPPYCESWFYRTGQLKHLQGTFWDLDVNQKAAVICISLVVGLVIGFLLAIAIRKCTCPASHHYFRV